MNLNFYFNFLTKKIKFFFFFRDAAWETEENAFHELTVRPNQCNANDCVCPNGRGSDEPSNGLMICETCGSNCIHQNCWQRKEPYYCCFPIGSKNATNSNRRRSTNNRHITSKKSEMIVKIRRKQKLTSQTDDEKLDEKRQKKLKSDKHPGTRSRDKRKVRLNCGSKVNCNSTDVNVNSKFPITTIRNGTFDQILRYTPRVLLYPLDPSSLETSNVSSKKMVEPSNSNRSLITSNFDKNFNKKEAFTIISPTRKTGGKSFKNYTITSFFKPFN